MIRLGHVSINERSKELVREVLESGEIGQSEMITRFEDAFAKWLGVKYCVAVASGTIADTVALAVLKSLTPEKTEVIVPALTFIAQVNSIYYNHLKPVFVDVEPNLQMNMTLAAEKININTLCLFPVHLLGNPARLDALTHISARYGVPFIEDACEAMGSEHQRGVDFKKCGSFGDMGTFSFFPSHTITTGEGGMIATDNEDYAKLARRLINHGKISSKDFHFDVVGFNGKMSSVTAAIGLGAIDDADKVIQARHDNMIKLGGNDANYKKVCPHAFYRFAKDEAHRDSILERLRSEGIECRNLFSSVPTQEEAYAYLGHKIGEFPVAEHIGKTGFYVPVHQGLRESDISRMKSLLSEMQVQ